MYGVSIGRNINCILLCVGDGRVRKNSPTGMDQIQRCEKFEWEISFYHKVIEFSSNNEPSQLEDDDKIEGVTSVAPGLLAIGLTNSVAK